MTCTGQAGPTDNVRYTYAVAVAVAVAAARSAGSAAAVETADENEDENENETESVIDAVAVAAARSDAAADAKLERAGQEQRLRVGGNTIDTGAAEASVELVYCPLADFGARGAREGQDVYAQAAVAQPVTAHEPLANAPELLGKIAVVQRGRCDFVSKVLHAQQAGAIAVLVANPGGGAQAFVMDAGRRRDRLADSVSIPAMMVSGLHSTAVFQEIREAYLDRRELCFTIRFLGAPTASQVLEQQEWRQRQNRNAPRAGEAKQQRELQQREAAPLLRTRLGKTAQSRGSAPASVAGSVLATPSTSAGEMTSDYWSPASSRSSSASGRGRARDQDDDIRRAGNQRELQQIEGIEGAAALAMLHWCPITTALVILDVQNYFTMRHGYAAKETMGSVYSGSDDEFGIERLTEPARCSSPKGLSSLEFYESVDNVLIPTIQDVLLASRATEGMEVIYSVVESATRDGRERSRAHKHAGIHVPKHGFGAQVPKRIAPDDGSDIVLPRTGVNVFAATNLDYLLRNLMVTHIVVMGISVLGSIESCVQTALDRGYQVSVLKEALLPLIGPSMSSKKASMLEGFSKRGVQVLSAADFVDKLQSFA
ncbi:unnamed protein product [Phytophthora fragariaefolia]|uniref:Unnamed protein product n=1 Tax=Phytophthora fragariaefolia TaxID=1490495 RepID=A0A9W7D6J1_9STRA|nr:unnamed protein product [Phytophthora fragariaefolia]